uniref:outer membrane beta-barrel protein n=1 Tax=Nitrosomonas sp. TaxID=42353 RepID=UPI0035AE06F2
MKGTVNYRINSLIALAGMAAAMMMTVDHAAANVMPELFKRSGLEIGGWINGGATYNANNPADGFNGAVTFADRANRFQLNQLNFFIERSVETDSKNWSIGGRFDFMFGTDAIYTQAFGISAFDENTGEPSDRGN